MIGNREEVCGDRKGPRDRGGRKVVRGRKSRDD